MIARDQPVCFGSDVMVRVSSRSDGTMLDKARGVHHSDAVANRRAFCRQSGISYDDVVYQRIVYGGERSYTTIAEVDCGAVSAHTPEVVADALVTTTPGIALLLPVADCVATVVYDPVRRILALLHLGRHSTVAGLMQKVLQRLIGDGSRPEDVIVWMSPNTHASHYVMEWFDEADNPEWREFCHPKPDGFHLDLQGYSAAVCRRLGLAEEHIHQSSINTVTAQEYFSHTAGDTGGRFAVLAMMR